MYILFQVQIPYIPYFLLQSEFIQKYFSKTRHSFIFSMCTCVVDVLQVIYKILATYQALRNSNNLLNEICSDSAFKVVQTFKKHLLFMFLSSKMVDCQAIFFTRWNLKISLSKFFPMPVSVLKI